MMDDPDNPQSADERLVHGLLLHLHDEQAAEHRVQRVDRAMAAIRAEIRPQRSPLRFPVWIRRVAYATAAVLAVAVGVWLLTRTATPALASLDDIIASLAGPGDRTYHISMQEMPEPPPPAADTPPERVPRPGLNDAILYLRDGRQYLLQRHDPNGSVIFDGFDGQKSWRARDGVATNVPEGSGGIPMPPMMADVPFSDLRQTMERIHVDYKTEQLDEAPLPSGGAAKLRHALLRRNSREVKGPETIEIWANPTSALPVRIVFDRAKIQGNVEPCRLTFDLVSEKAMSPDWFSPAAHARPASKP